jgi:hypothetical protein
MMYLWYLHCRAWDDWDMGIARNVAEQHRGAVSRVVRPVGLLGRPLSRLPRTRPHELDCLTA